MNNLLKENRIKISRCTLLYFLAMFLMLRPSNPALQALLGSVLGQSLNVFLKAGDYILITGILLYAFLSKIAKKRSIFTIQAKLICVFLGILVISTIKNGYINNFRAYYEYLGNIFCIVYLYQRARRDKKLFLCFFRGIAIYLTLSMLFNSLSIYLYYPKGMYTLDDGVSGNNNYYLYSLDNVTFIISLYSFAVHAIYNRLLYKKIKRHTVLIYVFIFSAYFYCRAATAILVTIVLFVVLVFYHLGLLKELNYKSTLILAVIFFVSILSIQSFSSLEWIFSLLGKNSLLGGRFRIWNAAFYSWLDNFWIGIGIDANITSSILYQHGFITEGWGDYIGHAHNIVFEIFLKSGLIGGICFGGQLLSCYKQMMKNCKSKNAQLLCVMFLLFWITSLLDYRIDLIGNWILFMLLYDIELLNSNIQGEFDER